MEVTKRGVLYVGLRCNANCTFCYYKYKSPKKFERFTKLKKQMFRQRYFYRNGFVDITGGEPTIHPSILDIVSYAKRIGLKPTIITNALKLADLDFCNQLKNAGINDFLISIYGVGKRSEEITGVKDTYKKQLKAMDNLNQLKIPFRINVTLHKLNLNQLQDIARLAANKGALAFNVINFNPFYEWAVGEKTFFQINLSKVKKVILRAVEYLEGKSIEVNLRYFPFCFAQGKEKNVYNFMQLCFDSHEWDYNSWINSGVFRRNSKWYVNHAQHIRDFVCGYKKSRECSLCSLRSICDGFNPQYIQSFGFGEETPYLGYRIKDPTFFIKSQKKNYLKSDEYIKPDRNLIYFFFNDKEYFFYFISQLFRKFFNYSFLFLKSLASRFLSLKGKNVGE